MAGKALEPSKLTGLMTAINDLARGSPALGKVVNHDHLKLLVMQAADDYPMTGMLDVQPLLEYLREQSPPRDEAEAILCAFIRRAQNLGVGVEPPRALQSLTEAERARLAEIALGRSQTAQKASTFVGHAPTARPGQGAVRVNAPPPPPSAPAPRVADGIEPPQKPRSDRTKALIVAAALLAVIAVIFFVLPLLGPDPEGDAQKLLGPPGDGQRYVCERVQVAERSVVCFLTIPTPAPADHAKKLDAVTTLAKANGWPTVVFVDAATNKKLPRP